MADFEFIKFKTKASEKPSVVREVLVCGKWWHLPRTQMLISFRFWEAGLSTEDVSLLWCESHAGVWEILKEGVKLLVTPAWYVWQQLKPKASTSEESTKPA